jgi:ribosome maturation factor RimP
MNQEMIAQEIIEHVRELADPILTAEGFELVEIEFRREARGWVLRLYVDKEGGITVDDCAWVSQEIGRSLDVEEVISSPYTLEVSSPGLTRPLKQEKDFMKYRDRWVKLTTNEPIGNQRHFKGRLRGIERNEIRIEVNGEMIQIPLATIAKAHLEIEF